MTCRRPGRPTTEPLLATDRVRFAGEPVAIVLTEDGYQGEDAAELVSVDYEPLDPVVGVAAALAGTSLLFPAAGSNVVRSGGGPAPQDAFDGCQVVVERTFPNQRVAPVPLEVRAAAARWADGRLTLWASTQNAQQARDQVAGALGLDAPAVRVVTPDVGGGFGAKIATDRDTIVVAWAARRLGRPVRWVETRNENLLGMVHGRAQQHTIRIGGSRDGRILAYHLDIVQDCGAYPRFGLFLPDADPADGERRVRPAVLRVQLPGGGQQHHPDLRLPRRRAARGDRGHRAGRGPVRRRDRDGPG